MKKFRNLLFLFIFLAITAYIFVNFYSYIFSRKVEGVITAVERVTPPMAIMTGPGQGMNQQVFSFAVGIRDTKNGEIVTGSTEDRQWAVARPGQCVEAEFFPYPPWDFPKWGTYFNVRLLKLRDCPPGVGQPQAVPPPSEPAAPAQPEGEQNPNQLFGQ